MVRAWTEGGLTPSTAADGGHTMTDLSGAFTLSSTPVMVTTPALEVWAAAMVRVLLDEMTKPPVSAGDAGSCGDHEGQGLGGGAAEGCGDVGDAAVLADGGWAEV